MTEFDYVIVGAGSAGCVLAHRLSESGKHSVLVLEAGGDDDRFWMRVPIGYGMSFYDPRVNWMYRTEPDAQLDNRSGYWPRGKVLGGSSTINAMVYVRGQPADFDEWAAQGNPGWSWADVLPVFRRLEDSDHEPGGARGRGGPLHVSDVRAQAHPLCNVYLQAAQQLGVPVLDDINGNVHEGVGINEITTRRGRRESASTAYLAPARLRANVSVQTNARATSLLFDGVSNRRVTGVRWTRDGLVTDTHARREVIVSAGSINTPQLLMLSGIGDGAMLQRHGIPLVADVPAVGQHLQDHLCIDHLYRSRVPSLNRELGTWSGRVKAGLCYLTTRSGPLALSVNQGGGFVRSRPDLVRPNLQLYFSPLSYTRQPRPNKRELTRPDTFDGFLLSAQPCRPTSRGHITLRSTSVREAPLIHANSLATEHDRAEMLEATRYLRRLAAAPALREVIAEELRPGASCVDDDALWRDIQARAGTVFHPVGTCRMGPDERSAVVDARLRAHRVAGLRIVDASVFPTLTSGNTNAPVLMVAEKAAAMMLEDAQTT